MWTWLQDNHASVNALASVLTLIIWTLYFQILLSSYRRTLRAKILINRGAGHHLQARCLIANMSAEPIYIEAVLIDVAYRTENGQNNRLNRCSLSDLDLELSDRSDPRPQWFQGPLDSSEWIDIGTYRQLMDAAGEHDEAAGQLRELTITVVATYRAQDALVAARRTFDIVKDSAGERLSPRHFTAEQIRARGERRAIERIMREGWAGEGENSVSSPPRQKNAG